MSTTAAGRAQRGPRIVAIGGGHGLARSLGAARRLAEEVAAVVSVADDGGSSGRLREELGIPAPGDLRRAIGALLPASTAAELGPLLEHRFPGGELSGHAFGNLLLAALAGTGRGFAEGVAAACRLLGTVGSVYPATAEPVVLVGEGPEGPVRGQVAVMATAGLSGVSLEPASAGTPRGALAAVAAADLVVLGPGSLYTSVLAALAAPELAAAVAAARGTVCYVANLREQPPETAGYDLAGHLRALARQGVRPQVVLADPAGLALGEPPAGTAVLLAPLASASGLAHDEQLLAEALAKLFA